MFTDFDSADKWTSKADNDELGAWVRLLRMASAGNVKGRVEIADGIPYTPEQIKAVIKTDKDYLKKWESQGAIKSENGVIIIENWNIYQSEYDRQKPYRGKLQAKVTSKSYKQSDTVDIDIEVDIDKDKEKDKNIVAVWCDAYKCQFGEQYKVTGQDAKILQEYKTLNNAHDVFIFFFKRANWALDYRPSIFRTEYNKIIREMKDYKQALKDFGGKRV